MNQYDANMDILNQAEGERALQQKVVNLALLSGWFVHAVLDTRVPAKRMGHPGFPDLVMAHPEQKRLIFAELKSQKGKTTLAQDEWLQALLRVGVEVYLWRPSDWEGIERILRKGRQNDNR